LPFARLVRPDQTAIVFAASVVGARLAPTGPATATVLVVATSNAALFAASVAFNDWHDVAEDRINRPRAPIVAGEVSPRQAVVASAALLALSLGLAAAAGSLFLAAVACNVVASVAYTLALKRVPVVGNVVVAGVATYALACWMLVATPSATYVLVTAGCFAVRLGGELMKTAQDAPGDGACGLRTVATAWGVGPTMHAGLALVVAGIALGCGPILHGDANGVYVSLLVLSGAMSLGTWMALLGLVGTRPSADRLVTLERAVTTLMAAAIGFGIRFQGL
jgi:geranylgeranylglycerol-phosphate geranylgeranyltransferase